MLEGICPECKVHYHGQALSNERNQVCCRCGSALEIRDNGVLVRASIPALKIEKFSFPFEEEEWENLCDKNLLFYLTMN